MLAALVLSAVLAPAPVQVVAPDLPAVTWQDLCDRPSRWLGKSVRLRIQFQAPVERWNPYLTRFGTQRFAAVQAWADEQLPWIRAEYEAPLVRLFAARGESCAWAFETARAGDRFEVTVVVRQVFLALPWAEVLEVLPLPERIGEGTVIHAGKAQELMNRGAWKLAELEIDQAVTEALPPHARAELERMRAECRDALAREKRPRRSSVGVSTTG